MNFVPHKLFDILPFGYVEANHHDQIISINKFMLDLIGLENFKPELGLSIKDFFTKGVIVFFETHLKPLLKINGIIEEISLELSRSNNSKVPVLMNGVVVESNDENSNLIYYYTFFDMTQRKLYEKELLISNQKQENLINQLNDLNKKYLEDSNYYLSMVENNSFFIVKTDLEGKYTFLNSFFCKRLGVKQEDWLGKYSLELIIPEDHQACMDTVQRCLENPSETQWVNLRKPLSTGGIIANQWEFKLIVDEDNNPKEFLCLGHDITDILNKQKVLEAQVETITEQNSRLNNFTNIVTHNLRNHLANLNGIYELNSSSSDSENKLAQSMLYQTIHSFDHTIRNLSDTIEIKSKTTLPLSIFSIQEEIGKVIATLKLQLNNLDPEINLNFSNDQKIFTNISYFESIIFNLISNSIKYRKPRHNLVINIKFNQDNFHQVISVQDNGLGIDLNQHSKNIFGMYKTFHGNPDAKGLGLFIIKNQIEALRGKIEVESALGVGTIFTVYFPNEGNELTAIKNK
jgi:PAS domain S-box-containing protein